MTDTIVLTNGDVQVTTRRLVVGAKTYQLSNITSFTTIKIDPPEARSAWGCFSLIGGLSAFGFAIYLVLNEGLGKAVSFVVSEGGWQLMLGGIVALLVAWGLLSAPPKYAVQLDTSSGAVNAIISTDADRINQISTALARAMEARG